MFVLGLIAGPAIGLLGADALFRSGKFARWQAWLVAALFLIFLVFAPFFILDLKLGLIAGSLSGFLLAMTPVPVFQSSEETPPR